MDTGSGYDSGGARRVTVWEADGSPWTGVGYGSEIARRLRVAGYSASVVPLQERLPDDEELASPLHVLSGGTTPATATTGWVGAARGPLAEVLDRAVSGSASVVGVCFGAQLIAVALAGPRAVRPARRGMEVGLSRVRCSVSGTDHVVSEFHHHEIRPAAIRSAGASLTFGNDHSEVQGFAIGSTIAGFQFHPELDPRRTASTIHANRTVIRSAGACPTAALRSVREHRRAWHPMSFDRLVVSRLGRVGTPDVAPAASTDRRSVAS